MTCETAYPYDFTIRYRVDCGTRCLAVRIPGWSRTYRIRKNGQECQTEPVRGYVYLQDMTEGDQLELELDGRAQFLYPSARIAADTGRVALQRGPLVYCLEGVDNGGDVLSLSVDVDAEISLGGKLAELPEDVVPLRLKGFRTAPTEQLYTAQRPQRTACEITAVPYYVWGNRGENQMRVWIPYAMTESQK